MEALEGVGLGLLQGLTEFLPVSSSGHLVLAQSVLPGFRQPGVLFDVLLHGGTLAAVVVYFRRDLASLVACLARGGDPAQRRLLAWIVAATVPTGVVGVAFRDFFERLFHAPRAAAGMLLVTGVLLWVSDLLGRARVPLSGVGFGRALAIGTVQGVSIIPGISRSGSTIAAGKLLGVDGEDAARFSFLISVPAVLGALVLEVPRLGMAEAGSLLPYAAGVLAAFGSGLWAIRFLLACLKKNRFRWFAVYCWAMGAGYLVFSS